MENKKKLIKEGSTYWEPDTGFIYDLNGKPIMHDLVYREPVKTKTAAINFYDYEIETAESRNYYEIYKATYRSTKDNSVKQGEFCCVVDSEEVAKDLCAKHSDLYYIKVYVGK